MTSRVASRYAKAIFDYLKGSTDAIKVADELEAFGQMIESSREARIVLVFGLVPIEKRKQVVEDLATRMQLSAETKRALTILTDAGRLRETTGVAERLRSFVSEKSGVIMLDVKTAEEVDSGIRSKIEDKFSKVLGSKVEARYTVDSGVMGGLKVSAAGRTFDGSVAGMLGTFQEQFAQGDI